MARGLRRTARAAFARAGGCAHLLRSPPPPAALRRRRVTRARLVLKKKHSKLAATIEKAEKEHGLTLAEAEDVMAAWRERVDAAKPA